MRFLLFSDPHISSKAEFSTPTEDGFTDYLHRVIDSFDWVCDIVKDKKPDFVAMLGDLFDTTGFVDTLSLHVGSRVCRKLSAACKESSTPLYWLVGNHDIYSQQSHNLKFLDLDNWGRVISLMTGFPNGLGYPVLFLPWGHELPQGDYHIILSHTEIKGGLLNSKKRSETGIDPHGSSWMFNGHYHIPDRVGRCYQVGSLLSRDFRDGYSDQRGAMLVTYDGQDCLVERLKNPHEIPYRTVEILTPHDAVKWSAEIDNGTSGLDRCYVRVVYDELYQEEADKVSLIALASKSDVRTCVGPLVEKELVSEVFSPDDNFKQYIDSILIFDEDSDRESALKKGLGYIEVVKKDLNTSTRPICFKRLTISNFQSIGSVDVDLYNQGLVLVCGENGVGKTTLLEALFWALTGKSLRFGDKAGDDVIGWESTGGCEVIVDLRVGGKDYIIKRGRKPNIVHLIYDGNHIGARRARDTEQKIEELIGRSKDVLQHSIFLTSDLETRFTALSYPNRVRLLEKITDASIYSSVESLVKTDLNKVIEDICFAKGSLATTESRIVNLNNRLREVNGQLCEVRKSQAEKLNELHAQVHDLLFQKSSLQERKDKLTAVGKGRAAEVVTAEGSLHRISDIVEAVKEKALCLGADVRSYEGDLDRKKSLVRSGRCPVCLSQDVAASLSRYIVSIEQLLEKKVQKLQRFSDKFKEVKEEQDARTKVLRNLQTTFLAIAQKVEEINSKLMQCDQLVNALQKKIAEVKAKDTQLESVRGEIVTSIDSETKLLAHNKEIEEKFAEEERVLTIIQKAFSTNGIRAMMLSSVTVPFLNSKIKEYSEILGMSFELTNRVESKSGAEDNKIEVILPGQRTYKSCSRGERRRVDLAVQCALNDLAIATGGSKVNLLVADEVIDPLDDSGVKAFIEVLQKKAQDSTVVLITHKPSLDAYAAKRWFLTKEYNVTNIKVV